MKICDTYCKRGKILLQKKMDLIKGGMSPEDASKCLYAFCPNLVSYYYAINIVKIPDSQVFVYDETAGSYIEWLKEMSERLGLFGKMDVVIQNPPYDGGLHLSFLKQGLELLNENGVMTIVEPAKWLIDVRKYGKRGEFGRVNSPEIRKYDEIKKQIDGHVKSVIIENLNKEFGTTIFLPFSITNIDLGNTYEYIDFTCCGEHKKVKSLYDCNMIGEYKTIWSIFNKVQSYGDMMKNHIFIPDGKNKTIVKPNTYYCKYTNLIARGVCSDYRTGDVWFRNNYYASTYIWSCFDDRPPIGISSEPLHSLKSGYTYSNPVYSDKIEDNLYGTEEELENWKYFIFNNKLPLFLNIVLNVDQHNVVYEHIPWLVDKQYTDEEINKKFGFTNDEIKLIEDTLKKYERNSTYFKRYMCGVEKKEI